jgi:hypothetical protein
MRGLALVAGLLIANTASAQPPPCGFSPSDWCLAPPGDFCGRYRNAQGCRADPASEGMRYRGESVVACLSDGSGFWTNCPSVGCVSGQPGMPQR